MQVPLLVLLATVLLVSPALAQTFAHPGLYNTAAELQHMADAVNANTQPQRRHYDNLHDVTTYTPRSNTTLVIETWTGNRAAEYNDFEEDCFHAYSAALQWVVENDAGNTATANARAAKAIEILNHMTTITGATGHDLQLRLALGGMTCHGAAEIMRYMHGGWAQAQAYANWTGSFVYPRLPSMALRNWKTSGAAARMAIGIVRNNQAQFDTGYSDLQQIIREQIIPPGRHTQTCRSGASPDFSLVGGDLQHVHSVLWTYARAVEMAKHQGRDLYNYVDPADGMGLEDMLVYHEPWYGFNQGRPGATSAGWPCNTPLAQVDTAPIGIWNVYYNHTGNSDFGALADFCNANVSATSTSCAHYYFFPHEGLTHRYNTGTPATPDTTDPTTFGSTAANAISSSAITISWTASTDNIGVTGYRIDECSTAACTPSVQLTVANGLTYTHMGLGASSLHRYRIRALDAAGNDSAQTATVEATTQAATPSPEVTDARYVATTGNNGNAGTIGSPWATPAFGISQLIPGRTLYIRGGAYGIDQINPPSGTSDTARVYIRNYPGEVVYFVPGSCVGSNCQYRIMMEQDRFITIEGDYVPGRAPPGYAPSSTAGCYAGMGAYTPPTTAPRGLVFHRTSASTNTQSPSSTATNNVLRNLEIRCVEETQATGIGRFGLVSNIHAHHNGRGGLDHGIYQHEDDVTIENSEFSHHSGYGIQYQNTNESNGSCTANCGVNRVIMRGNSFHHNEHGGFILRGTTGVGQSQVYNNISWANSGTRGALIANPSSLFANNTVYGNNVGIGTVTVNNCQVIIQNLGTQIINNLVWGSATNRPAFCVNGVAITTSNEPSTMQNNIHGTSINPLVTNPTAGDFRLLAGSPAINTGLTLAGVPRDFFGASRPAGLAYDIGMHEFGGIVTPPAGDATAPSTPTLLTLTLISPTQVNLDWADSTDNVAVTGYHVYRCSHTGSGCIPLTVIASPATSAYSDTSVAAGKQYIYAVAAADAAGNLSPTSATAAITTSTPPPDITAPSVPTSPIATALTADQIGLSWTASTDAVGVTGYLIRRCTGGACTPSTQIDVTATNSYTSLGLSPSTTYGFAVAARDASNNISAYSTTAYATTPAASTTPSIILLLNNNTTNTGTAGGTPVNTGVTFTTVAAERAEGSHAGDWNSTTDVIMVPTTGFLSPTNLTIALTFYPRTNFSVTRALFGHSSTTPGFADRLQLRTTDTARLGIGLGDNSMVSTDVTGAALTVDTQYRVWLRVSPTGYRVSVARAGTGFIAQTSGSHNGLTTLGANFAIGNNMVNNTQGFLGSIDAVEVVNREWSDVEVTADCVARVASCTAPTPPTFDPFVMVTGTQGNGASSQFNPIITVTMIDTPDPAACNDLTQFYLAYEQVRVQVSGCSLVGSILQLTASSPPPSVLTNLTLSYLPTAQQIALTNDIVIDAGPSAGLQQLSYWCRPDCARTPSQCEDPEDPLYKPVYWYGLPNQECTVPSPGIISLRVDVGNTDVASSPSQSYALYCDTDLLDQTPAQRITEESGPTVGISLNRSLRGVAHGAVRSSRALPNVPGLTFAETGVLIRENVVPATTVIAPDTRVEFEYPLRFESDLARETLYTCDVRPSHTGEPLTSVNPALIRIGAPRFLTR